MRGGAAVVLLWAGCGADPKAPQDEVPTESVPTCHPVGSLDVLVEHVQRLADNARVAAEQADAGQGAHFFELPGFSGGPTLTVPLMTECSGPSSYAPWCEGALCWQVSCTGVGSGYVVQGWIEQVPYAVGDFQFEAGTSDVTWAEGTGGVSFSLSSTATGPSGTDYSVVGQGASDADGTRVSETFSGLLDVASVLEVEVTPYGISGEIFADGLVVATVGTDGSITPTGECP
jgi:hypothetical protein